MGKVDTPFAIHVKVRYDKNLQKITKQDEQSIFINKGSTFAFLLHCIFVEYPEIQKKYLPGTLGFTVNGKAPGLSSLLFDEDEIWFEGRL